MHPWCLVLSMVAAVAVSPASSAVLNTTRNAGLSADADEFALPPGLLLGAGVSAIQTEGAWNEDGKGESAQDFMLHTGVLAKIGFPPGPNHLHDTAADSYHRYKDDIAMAAQLKLKLFRFSFSWSRLLPTGDSTKPNDKGVQFYHDYIDEIIKYGMTPMATLYHFDHPQVFETQFNGWSAPNEMIPKFKEYARFVFNTYSSKVKLWTTINEPNMYCTFFIGADDPNSDSLKEIECIRTNILAHAEAYHAFKDDKHDGLVGFSSLILTARAASALPEDVHAADAFNQFQTGLTLHPVVFGDYPELVKRYAAGKITMFTDEEKARIKGTSDFIGLNVYYGMKAAYLNPKDSLPRPNKAPAIVGLEFLPFVFVGIDADVKSGNPLTMIAPEAMRNALLWTWQSYGLPIIITENGLGDTEGLGKQDLKRAAYSSAYLRTLVKTMKEFDIKVLGYCSWSLIDSYEWSAGFGRPFGLVHVDYAGGTLDRSLKDSSQFWIDMAKTGVVPFVEVPADVTTSATSPATSTSRPPGATSTSKPSKASSDRTATTATILVLATAALASFL